MNGGRDKKNLREQALDSRTTQTNDKLPRAFKKVNAKKAHKGERERKYKLTIIIMCIIIKVKGVVSS